MLREIRLSRICEFLHLRFYGSDIPIHGLNLCDRKSAFDNILSYATSKKYVAHVKNNINVSCLVLREDFLQDYASEVIGRDISYILSDEPEKVFYEIHAYLHDKTDFYEQYDFPARIGMDCNIDKTAVIQDGTVIGNRVCIGPMSIVRKGSVIGDDVEIGCHTVIGGEGFQILRIDGENWKIPHVGGCKIGRNCRIGDHVVICNSLFEDTTYIGNNVMIDNFVHVAHNVVIDDYAVLTGGTDLAGSCHIGQGAWIGPNATVANKVTVGDYSLTGIGSTVIRNVKANTKVFGVPAIKI